MGLKHNSIALLDEGFNNVIRNFDKILVEVSDGRLRFDQYKRIKRMKGRTIKYIQRHQKKVALRKLKVALHKFHRFNWLADELNLIDYNILTPVQEIVKDNIDNPHIYESRKRKAQKWDFISKPN